MVCIDWIMLVLFLLGWKAKMPMAQVEQIFCFTSPSWYQGVRRTTVAEQVVEFEVSEEFDIIVRRLQFCHLRYLIFA
jgi:hypothetical protein